MSTKIHNRKSWQVRISDKVHHELKYFSLEQDSPMSKQLDMLVLFALDKIASQGIREYKNFIKQQKKINESKE